MRKEERLREEVQTAKSSMQWKWFIIGAVVMAIGGLLSLVIYQANKPPKPLPGLSLKELGRDHITDISGITYTSNPPTSGSHFSAWAKRGVYDKIISDGYLLHSLEHGYIIISYNCGQLAKMQKSLQYQKEDPLTTTPNDAQALMAAFTPETLPKDTLPLPEQFSNASCTKLVSDLRSFLNEYQRIVIVPRPNLDQKIVLTAWGRMEKFSKFEEKKMREFIAAFHNAGPEQTAE